MFRLTTIAIFLTFSFSALGQELNKESTYYQIYESAKKAKAKDSEGIRGLYKMSLKDHDDAELNKLLIKSTVLGMLSANSKVINTYMPAVDAKFIALDPLAFLGQTPFQTKCFKCRGEGFNKHQCKHCIKGVCKNCKGQKQIVYKGLGRKIEVKKCELCQVTGKCISCDGKGTAHKGCHICYEKGSLFNRKPITEEYDKTLDYIIAYLPKYAAGKNVFITDEMVAMAKDNRLKKELEEARKLAAKKKAEELALLEEERTKAMRKRQEKESVRNEALKAAFGDAKKYTNVADDNLQHVLLEFNQFFRNRERIQKQSIYVGAEAKYEKGKPTLIIEVTPSIGGMGKGLKLQYLEAFYNFFKLRCMSNGLGKNVGYTAQYKKKDIATFKDGEVVLQ